jgi:ribonuclease P protein component
VRTVLPQPNRLRRRADFVRVTRTGRRCTRGSLTAYLLAPAPPADGPAVPQPARVGFVVSRALGGAVVRNAVTRRLRVVARERLDQLPAGVSLVVRALPGAATASLARLTADLDACLERLLATSGAVPGAPA